MIIILTLWCYMFEKVRKLFLENEDILKTSLQGLAFNLNAIECDIGEIYLTLT